MTDIQKPDFAQLKGQEPAQLYDQIPCTVGYQYMRFEVSGDVRPCCISKYPIGLIQNASWRSIWRSAAYQAFRLRMSKIHNQKFHRTDPEFAFCLQCSHVHLNFHNAQLLFQPSNGIKEEK
jgi:MoaA/NifB/PqqE/SkfB family radical SAM enzyme